MSPAGRSASRRRDRADRRAVLPVARLEDAAGDGAMKQAPGSLCGRCSVSGSAAERCSTASALGVAAGRSARGGRPQRRRQVDAFARARRTAAAATPAVSRSTAWNSSSFDAACIGREIAYLPQERIVHWPVTVSTVVGLGRLPHRTHAAAESEADREAVAAAMAAMDVHSVCASLGCRVVGRRTRARAAWRGHWRKARAFSSPTNRRRGSIRRTLSPCSRISGAWQVQVMVLLWRCTTSPLRRALPIASFY